MSPFPLSRKSSLSGEMLQLERTGSSVWLRISFNWVADASFFHVDICTPHPHTLTHRIFPVLREVLRSVYEVSDANVRWNDVHDVNRPQQSHLETKFIYPLPEHTQWHLQHPLPKTMLCHLLRTQSILNERLIARSNEFPPPHSL